MPVDRSKYPPDWPAISRRIRYERAGNRCEWIEDGNRCEAINGQPHPITGSKVVLTVMHLDHDPENNDETNLLAACQWHHNQYDAPMRARNAAETRRRKQIEQGQRELFREDNRGAV